MVAVLHLKLAAQHQVQLRSSKSYYTLSNWLNKLWQIETNNMQSDIVRTGYVQTDSMRTGFIQTDIVRTGFVQTDIMRTGFMQLHYANWVLWRLKLCELVLCRP